jgi:branched-chain amino acid transport system ATP-binding protein
MSEPLLAVRSLNAYYGPAHILQGVTFEMGVEPVALIGRNGMGKSTLCNAIMGLVPDVKGSVRLNGEELIGRQGRRLFPSLSTDEHLRMLGSSSDGAWSRERVYDLFPRLAERRNISATQLSGGEQQMLAIGRTLLRNPRLLIMDEPSEGLAPTIIESVIGTCLKLVEGGMGLLLVEQNLGVATAICERQLVMIAGEIATETTAAAIQNDPDAQQRYLGVTRVEATAG